jgi:hypothetical protein
MEEFIAGTRHTTNRGARLTSYFCFGLGLVLIISSVAFHFDLHAWPLTIFIAACGVGFEITAVGYMRVAKRNTDHGAA